MPHTVGPRGDEVEYERIEDALHDCVSACGGVKKAAALLFPEKAPEAAATHLRACMNENCKERLSPEHLLLLIRSARDRGCHAGMQYIAAALGYAMPQPIEPADEVAELQRRFIRATEQQKHLAEQMQQAAERMFAQTSRASLKSVA